MIITELYKGQGLGNQLACYVTTRVLALDLGFDFGIMHPERFKGHGFFEAIDFGCPVEGGYGPEGGPPISLPTGISNYYVESALRYGPSDIDIRSYDKELRNIKDGTKIDGLLQGEGYFLHRREEIKQWLKLNPKHDCFDYADENTCIINFRGGEYSRVPEFFLGKTYWDNAISKMLEINSFFRFVVITDDVYTARKFFPKFPVFHFSIGKDYSIIKNAQYLILSNSSFGWFPSWLSENQKYCIAPKYWARHNISDGYWSLGYNLTSGWHYMDRQGNLHSYEDCLDQLASFEVSMKRQKQQPEFASKNANFLGRVKGITPVWVKKLFRGARGWTQYVFNLLLHPVSLYLERKARSRWLADIDLSEYKKTIRVYDVFYFFNELDLLEIRLNILDRYVDYFVLVEFSQTFGGVKKDSFYKKNKNRYAKWNHKIIYFLVDDYPSDKNLLKLAESNSNVGNGAEHWVREFYLKESAKKALSALNDEDIVFVSDLDEIWDPGKLKEFTNFEESEVVRPVQLSFYYYLNNRSNENINGWTGTIVTRYEVLRNSCLNDLRNKKKTHAKKVLLGGWHFTYLGGVEGAKRKLSQESHPEYRGFLTKIEETVGANKHYGGKRLLFWKDETGLPEYLIKNREKWKNLFR